MKLISGYALKKRYETLNLLPFGIRSGKKVGKTNQSMLLIKKHFFKYLESEDKRLKIYKKL